MKIQSAFSFKRGFTLIELMVAMAITTIIVTILVSITSMATDTWNRSRAELRASHQAKAMVDAMAHDLESLVTRRGTSVDPVTKKPVEWLSAVSSADAQVGNVKNSNASKLIFFAGATDRYDGNIGNTDSKKGTVDLGGDVSCIAYNLFYKDPIVNNGVYTTFVFKRLLIDPKAAFDNMLGKSDLNTAFAPYNTKLDEQNAFVCENVYQFTITFHIEASHVAPGPPSTTQIITVPVSIGNTGTMTNSLKINGMGVDTTAAPSGVTTDELKAGRVVAVELSITVLSDAATEQIRRSKTAFTDAQTSTLLVKHGYNYSKRIQVPRP